MESKWKKIEACRLITDIDREFIKFLGNDYSMVCIGYLHEDSVNATTWKKSWFKGEDDWYEKCCIIVDHAKITSQHTDMIWKAAWYCNKKYNVQIQAGCGNHGYQVQINAGVLTRAAYKLINNEWYVLPHKSVLESLILTFNL